MIAQVGVLEQAADQPVRVRRDDDGAGLGERLQAGGEVRGLPDRRVLLRGAAADEVADHHPSRRNADARAERRALGRAQPADGVDDLEPRPDRPLGIVLVRPGKTEVGKHAVAHELGHDALSRATTPATVSW